MAVRLKFGHASLQFSDSDRAHTADIEKIFGRGNHILTGTEAGPGAGNTSEELLRIGKEAGYRMWVPSSKQKRPQGVKGYSTDCWIGVHRDLITGDWEVGYEEAIPGSSELNNDPEWAKIIGKKRWGPKGLVHVGFNTENLGRINVGAAHYLTDARGPHSPYWDLNKRLAGVISDWAVEVAKGSGLAFYGGDQNMADNKNREPQGDTFFGGPFTSAWDELEFWQNTGHGNIDVIASYDGDKRVTAKRIRAFNDSQFFLHTDHFLVEAVYLVEPLVTKPPAPQPVVHNCPACGLEHSGVVTQPVS